MKKNRFKYIYSCLFLLALVSCKKGSKDDIANNNTTTTTTTTVTPQADAPVAKSIGFFLDDWAPKNFTAPAFTDIAKPDNATVTINVDYSKVVTKVSKYLFGNNTNPYMSQIVTEPVLLNNIKTLSPNILRFPGGNISSVYFWNASPGNERPSDAPTTLYDSDGNPTAASYWGGKKTDSWTLSLDNYYNTLQQTNSTGIITVNYSYARYGLSTHPDQMAAHLAADWVRYDKGRTKYWEIGNESDGPWQAGWKIDISKNKDGQPEIINGGLYGKHFKIFADSMRKAATEIGVQIKIGAQLVQTDPVNAWNAVDKTWNSGFFASAGDYADFYIVHDYYTSQSNESAATILNSPVTESKAMMDWMNTTTTQGGVPLKPVALTEWNLFATGSKQMVSNVAGIHATMVLGELLKNNFGMASRWDLANGWSNGDDQGMFNQGDEPDGISKWGARPAFYYMYYFQKYFGDRMISSTVQNNADVLSYASSFNSGEAGIVIVNKGTSTQTINISLQNFVSGSRYYYYTFVGGNDNGEFSRKVYINGNGPDGAAGGPSNYLTLKANASTIQGGIKVLAPPRSVVFVVAEGKK
ncbi:alpha-L-arabinofuranosidase [Mucilaginibacter arboris]|uniref:Alpha-L-arabinofuranosidase n=1 Tax=Mucilaginibacter arboris TaxID=2682090 RepID=A0A7K1T0J0_9SPHI|nr:alpha-L-arabinofuranosidase [Mucilaginibacter arboris]MVN23075.1 alpha-L-arabinofuranosidase [Mucilaginibacter arboris]